jgi:Nucleotidyl transferase AbiEii toxin, Type IV TA system
VITRADIDARVAGWGRTEEVIEKDYVLGWLLWGIGSDPVLGQSWVFKGGTCLKKCYIETYRFSEDLDFTVLPKGPYLPDDMLRGLRELGLSAQGLPDSVAHLRTNLDDEYALATRRVATDAVDLLVDMSQQSEPAEWARAIDSQGAIREVIEVSLFWSARRCGLKTSLMPSGRAREVIAPPRCW